VKVTIVGGGVVGLAAAYSLLDAGCDIVLMEARGIPNPSSASYDLSRMMRVQYGPESGYAQLAKRALTSWAKLENALGTRLYRPTGVCVWPATSGVWTEATRRAFGQAGLSYRDVSRKTETTCLFEDTALGDGISTQEGGVLLAKEGA
jgi:glycine/D-amino acid oxidase-like deaminating enzyme